MSELSTDSVSRPKTGAGTQLAGFRQRCAALTDSDLGSSEDLYRWSVEHYRDFWRAFLDWADLAWEGSADVVCTSDDVEHATFFPDVRLNYAENLLRPLPSASDESTAFTSVHGDGTAEHLSRAALRKRVQATATTLATQGVAVGDRVVVIAANNVRAAVASLAVTALGAAVSTAMPDMGPAALLGRFEQVEPAVLVLDRTGFAGLTGVPGDTLSTLVDGLPTLRCVLVLDAQPLPELAAVRVARLDTATTEIDGEPAVWPRLPFNQPLFVMFSSGTTGPPKAMVHGVGGTLLEHVKEQRLHNDMRPDDTYYHHSTTAWMVWNRHLSTLATGAHVVVYDGPVRGPETLWHLTAEHGVTVFGTSPAYLQLCQDSAYGPADDVDLSGVRAVLSMGAVLEDWQYDWFADAIGPVPLWSSSGGTDIIGAFVLSQPELPVPRGRIQTRSLGMDVAAVDEHGHEIVGAIGELVCRNPFPSRPVNFLRDPDGQRYHASYFTQHAGMWTHGDLIEIGADGSARMHGRSDGVVNVNGVRIGPVEIYAVLRHISQIADAMAVEQGDPAHRGQSRLVLLLVMRPDCSLDDDLARLIRSTIRREASPAHVPSLIVSVDELPVTHNGKPSERAARDALNGSPVRNLAALKNASCLDRIVAAAGGATQELNGAKVPYLGVGDLTSVVRRAFHEVLGSPVPDTADFFDAGGTSRQSIRLLRQLRLELDRPLLMSTLLAAPTVVGVAAALAAGNEDDSPVELLRTGDAGEPPLYLVHGRHGDADIYWTTVEHLGVAAPVFGLTARLQPPSGWHPSIVELARQHVATVTSVQPYGPLRLAGFSFGGMVAYEMARQFAVRGRPVAFLGLLDVHPPTRALPPVSRFLSRSAARISSHIPGMTRNTVRTLPTRIRRRSSHPARPGSRSAREVYNDYRWGSYTGPVTYFRARRRIPVVMNQLYEWRRVAPRMTVVGVPGAHNSVLSQENAAVLAARLSEALRASNGRAGAAAS